MLSVQGKPGALEVADQREQPGHLEQPGHTQWQEEGQQVGKHHHLLENEGNF